MGDELDYDSNSTNDADERGDSPKSTSVPTNIFQNDGSFMEMFKKMQKAGEVKPILNKNNKSAVASEAKSVIPKKKIKSEPLEIEVKKSSVVTPQVPKLPIVGRRNGKRVLPIGKVEKVKVEESEKATDAWSKYMLEVKKYKETYCEKTTGSGRSLVK